MKPLPAYGTYKEGRDSAFKDILEAIRSYDCKSVKEVETYLSKAIAIAKSRGSTTVES